MKPPCVTIVKHVLPAIRVLVMKELIEKYDMRKIDASEKMELTPAAITQYSKGERGMTFLKEIMSSEDAMKKVSKLAETIAKGGSVEEVLEKLCEICDTIRSQELICDIHQQDLPALKERKCGVCERPCP
ncbi:MAG: hypothetical protein QW667_06060 [Candidatus Bathyarchaeia archaeon]